MNVRTASPDAGYSPAPMQMSRWSRQFSADMTVSAGSVVTRELVEERSPVFEGLQIIVSLNARMRGGVDGRPCVDIGESGLYLVLASGRHEGYDRYEAGALQRYVKIAIDPATAERHGFDLPRIANEGGGGLSGSDVMVVRRAVTPALRAIATQILVCPLQGSLRDVYLAGKGLELTATALEGALAGTRAMQDGLSAQDRDRLWRARDLAVANFHEPLTLHELARQSGTNVKKLNAGFRQLFGMSVFEFIQDYRLREAYRMLSTGAYSVSEVASYVGYAIPHFSTLFRKQFGRRPSEIAG